MRALGIPGLSQGELVRYIDRIEAAVVDAAELALEECIRDTSKRLSDRQLKILARSLVHAALRKALQRILRIP